MDAQTARSPLHVSRTDHDDGWTVAVDLNLLQVSDVHVTVDIIGTEAVIAVDAPQLQTEFDIELPAAGAAQTLQNGVLTLEQKG
ncbi:MAG: hypothetical protein ABEH86_11025 [Haloarcula sp.]